MEDSPGSHSSPNSPFINNMAPLVGSHSSSSIQSTVTTHLLELQATSILLRGFHGKTQVWTTHHVRQCTTYKAESPEIENKAWGKATHVMLCRWMVLLLEIE